MPSSLLVSEEGLDRVKAIFDRTSALHVPAKEKLVRQFQSGIFDSTADFDRFYAAIYALRVGGLKTARFSSSPPEADQHVILHFDLISDISVGGAIKRDVFKDTLLDEFAVSELASLKLAVEKLIPLDTKLAEIEVGCVYLKFNIFASRNITLTTPQFPGFSNSTLNSSPRWQSLFERFSVSSYSIYLP